MNKERKIWIKPYGTDSVGNEHWIYATGDELEDESGDMTWEMEDRIKEIFPDGSGRGSRFEIHHQPTEEELMRLRALATELNATFESEIRPREAYEEMRNSQKRR